MIDLQSIARDTAEQLGEDLPCFRRGEPLRYFERLARLNQALTLPGVPAASVHDAVLLKVLYGIWNIVIDDEIDRDGTSEGLDRSIRFLMGERPSGDARERGGGVVALLKRMEQLVPGGRLDRSDALGFDLWEVVHGLNYELFINRHRGLATVGEYRRYSTMTASFKVLLDIDCLFMDVACDPFVYKALRQAYDEISCAVKLAGDIGTLRREVHEEDNMSLPRILASERRRDRDPGAPDAKAALAEASEFKDEVAAASLSHLANAEALFARVPTIEAGTVLGSVRRVVQVYLSGVDPFFD